MNIFRRSVIWTAICLIGFFSVCEIFAPKSAAAEPETGKSLTLTCVYDNTVLSGMNWTLYRVGERRGDAFVLTGDFADYPVNLNDMSASAVTSAAKVLENYAAAGNIPPLMQGETDTNGKLTFTGIGTGLYLASGSILQLSEAYYTPSSLLIEIADDISTSAYDAYPKINHKDVPADPSTTTTATSENTGSFTTSTHITTAPKDSLISTGQLKWPVIPLSALGLLLLGKGIALKLKKDNNEK